MPGDLPNLHVVSLQVTRDSRTYSVGVCTAAAGPEQGGCKDGGVCLLSGDSKGASFGRLASMQLDYRHQDEAVILSYVNGDTCPPGDVLSGALAHGCWGLEPVRLVCFGLGLHGGYSSLLQRPRTGSPACFPLYSKGRATVSAWWKVGCGCGAPLPPTTTGTMSGASVGSVSWGSLRGGASLLCPC